MTLDFITTFAKLKSTGSLAQCLISIGLQCCKCEYTVNADIGNDGPIDLVNKLPVVALFFPMPWHKLIRGLRI